MRNIIDDIKTYLKIKLKYPKIYMGSQIHSLLSEDTKVGRGVIIKKNVAVSSALKKIGNHVYIGDGTSVFECSEIGNFTSISHGVKIGLTNHALDHIGTSPLFFLKARGWVKNTTFDELNTKRAKIEHDVLISANVMIMNGVKIGTGAVIGAGAFVNKDVPPYAIVVGNPAKIIKYRFDEPTIANLLESKWWELNDEILIQHRDLFNKPIEFLNAIKKHKI